MIQMLFFLIVTCIGSYLSLIKAPFYGLVTYAFVYFNSPNPDVNWWANFLPEWRWSLICAVILVWSMLVHREKLAKPPLQIFYFVVTFYICVLLSSIFDPVNPKVADYYAHIMLTNCIAVFFIIKCLKDLKQFKLFLLTIIILAAILGVRALIEGEFLDDRLNNIGPADACESNEFGVLLGSIIPFCFPFFLKGSKIEKIICYTSLPLIANGLTLTVSRSALLSLSIGILYISFLADKAVRRYILILSILMITVLIFCSDKEYIDRISTILHINTKSQTQLNRLSSGRTDVWRYGLKMLKDYPWGTGPGGFREISRFYMPPEALHFDVSKGYGVRAAHNSYLLVMVELGYPGSVIYLMLCLFALYTILKKLREIKQQRLSSTFFGLAVISLNASFIVTLVGGFFNSRVYYEFFWWQLGLIIVASAIELDDDSEDIPEQSFRGCPVNMIRRLHN